MTDGVFIKDDRGPKTLMMHTEWRVPIYIGGGIQLAVILTCTVVTMFAILTFRMLMNVSARFDEPVYRQNGPTIANNLNVLWIVVMNTVYTKVATILNDLENHRTDTQYEDALITKTFLFQFFNSYSALLYVAFIKAVNLPLFNGFGEEDEVSGKSYTDTCGRQGISDFSAVQKSADTPCDPSTADLFDATCKQLTVRCEIKPSVIKSVDQMSC